MQRPGPASEFEHLPQHGDMPPCRRIPEHFEHAASGIRVGVIAVVDDLDSAVFDAFSAHLSRLERPDRILQTRIIDSKDPSYGDSGKDVADGVAAGQLAFERHCSNTKSNAIFAKFRILRPDFRFG